MNFETKIAIALFFAFVIWAPFIFLIVKAAPKPAETFPEPGTIYKMRLIKCEREYHENKTGIILDGHWYCYMGLEVKP